MQEINFSKKLTQKLTENGIMDRINTLKNAEEIADEYLKKSEMTDELKETIKRKLIKMAERCNKIALRHRSNEEKKEKITMFIQLIEKEIKEVEETIRHKTEKLKEEIKEEYGLAGEVKNEQVFGKEDKNSSEALTNSQIEMMTDNSSVVEKLEKQEKNINKSALLTRGLGVMDRIRVLFGKTEQIDVGDYREIYVGGIYIGKVYILEEDGETYRSSSLPGDPDGKYSSKSEIGKEVEKLKIEFVTNGFIVKDAIKSEDGEKKKLGEQILSVINKKQVERKTKKKNRKIAKLEARLNRLKDGSFERA